MIILIITFRIIDLINNCTTIYPMLIKNWCAINKKTKSNNN